MKTRIAIITLLSLGALAAPAQASTRHFEGSFADDEDATISLDLVIRHGEPTRVRDLTVTDLDYRCSGSGEEGERSATFDRVPIFESARDGLLEFEAETSADGAYFVAGGLMRPSLRKIKGGVAYAFDGPSGPCESSAADVGRFVAR
jgi:hypothetical protein